MNEAYARASKEKGSSSPAVPDKAFDFIDAEENRRKRYNNRSGAGREIAVSTGSNPDWRTSVTRSIELGHGRAALLSEPDYSSIAMFKWRSREVGNTSYAYGYVPSQGAVVLMHRFLLNAPENLEVDHINGDGLDNRRENLRLATRRQNAQNSRAASCIEGRPVSSKYKGVFFDDVCGKWRTAVRNETGRKYCGVYVKEVDAALAYDQAARIVFGEYARLNFPDIEASNVIPDDILRRLALNGKQPRRDRKLVDWQVKAIRRAHEEVGLSFAQLARAFGVSESVVRRICHLRTYKTVT